MSAEMKVTTRNWWIASVLTLTAGGFTPAFAQSAPSDGATVAQTGQQSAASTDSNAQSGEASGSVQSTSLLPQEATRPLSFFPSWSLKSTRNIDPRIRPNAGLRVPLAYYPIADGPRLYPNFSPVSPDFLGGQPTTPWSVRESFGLFGVDDDHVSSKFQEFRDVRNGATMGFEGHYRQDNTVLNVIGRQIGRRDQDVNADGAVAGKYLWGVSYNETPHTYAFDARSMYRGVGTRELTLPDAMQIDLQTSTSLPQLSEKLLGYINRGAQAIDESVQRQTIGADLTLLTTYPFVLRASASNESRDGVRPWSGSFGFANFVEIPWPVKYDTRDFRVSGEYAKPESNLYASASVHVSDFVNQIESFTFDNPYRSVDGPGALNCTFLCGPEKGRMSLYPSNQYNEISGVVALKKLPLNSTFNAVVSAGFMRQDAKLLPFATNSADPPMRSPTNPSFNTTDPAGLPRDSAETAMDTQTISMRWTSELSNKARLVGQYRMYKLDNNEKPFTIYQFVREDEDIRNPETPFAAGGTYATVLAAYSKHTLSLEGTYQITPMSKVTGVYTYERMNRKFREVARMSDNKFKVEYDSLVFGRLELKTWYERTQRTTSPYEFDQYNIVQGNPAGHPMLPWLEKFDEAPYGRNEVQAMGTYALSDSMTFSTHLQLAATDYGVAPLGPISMATENVTVQASEAFQFGVQWDRMSSWGLDYTWAPTDRWSLFADAGVEERKYKSMARQWTVNGISDPYLRQPVLASNSNWTVVARDKYLTAGLGGDANLVQNKLKLSVQYVYAKSDGRHDYTSPVGTAAVDDVNAFVPQPFDDVDDTTSHSFNPELTYQYSDHLSLAAGYQWEKWQVDDYTYKGFSYAPLYTNGVAMLMGGLLPKPYSANIAYVRLRMGF